MNFVRYPFFFVNAIFMVVGILIMSYGILLLTNYSVLEDMLYVNTKSVSNYTDNSHDPIVLRQSPAPRWLSRIRDPASFLLIIFGSSYFTLAFMGYFGAVKDSRLIMVCYAVLLGAVIVIEMVGVSLYVKYKPDLKTELVTAMSKQYQREEMKSFTQFEFVLDLIMINYKCCGVNDYRDFKTTYAKYYSVRSIPIPFVIDPRSSKVKGNTPRSVTLSSLVVVERGSLGQDEMEMHINDGSKKDNKDEMEATTELVVEDTESRIITPPEIPMDREVPATCCKLKITTENATEMLRSIYLHQGDRLKFLQYATNETCVEKPDETNSYVGDFQGCFDKIQVEIMKPLRMGLIAIGFIQLCGFVFSLFIFKAAYYDWMEL